MKIYLDTCCYGRPWDDQTQTNILAETAAIKSAIKTCCTKGFAIIGSPMLIMEINNITILNLRQKVMNFYSDTTTMWAPMTALVEARARQLQAGGQKVFDSYHAALSESAEADYLLTTDPKFVNAAARLGVKTKVINPINFIKEYLK